MSTLTIPRLCERTHARLLRQAAENGRSVEAEVRAILDAAVGLPDESTPWRCAASLPRPEAWTSNRPIAPTRRRMPHSRDHR